MQWFFNIQVGYYTIYMSIFAYTLGRSWKLGNDRKWWKSSAHTVHVRAWRRCWRLCWGSNGAVHKVIGLIKKKKKKHITLYQLLKSVTANHENKNMFSSGPLWPLSTVKISTSMASLTHFKTSLADFRLTYPRRYSPFVGLVLHCTTCKMESLCTLPR